MTFMSALSILLHWLPSFRHQNTPIETLNYRRHIFEIHLLSLDAIIRRLLALSTESKKDIQDLLDSQTQVSVTTDGDGTLSMSIISLCSPSVLAYVREWQQAVHVLACIDIAVFYISWAATADKDPLIDRICETMMVTILAFALPDADRPAQPRPDDADRIRDCRVFTNEPPMHALIASLDNTKRAGLDAATERARARLPLFPASFRDWQSENKGRYVPKHVEIAVNKHSL